MYDNQGGTPPTSDLGEHGILTVACYQKYPIIQMINYVLILTT